MKLIDIKRKNKAKTLVKFVVKLAKNKAMILLTVVVSREGFSLATFGISKKRIRENAPKIVVKAAFGTEKKRISLEREVIFAWKTLPI